jgi:cytochrome c
MTADMNCPAALKNLQLGALAGNALRGPNDQENRFYERVVVVGVAGDSVHRRRRRRGRRDPVQEELCDLPHAGSGKNKIGPSLAGVVGRKAGSVPGFAYSAANKNSGDIWDAQTLDIYLTDPRRFMPGTKMVFAGLKNPEDRKALIEYLKEQH